MRERVGKDYIVVIIIKNWDKEKMVSQEIHHKMLNSRKSSDCFYSNIMCEILSERTKKSLYAKPSIKLS